MCIAEADEVVLDEDEDERHCTTWGKKVTTGRPRSIIWVETAISACSPLITSVSVTYSQHSPQAFGHAGFPAAFKQLLCLSDAILRDDSAIFEVASGCTDACKACGIKALQTEVTRGLAEVLVQARRDARHGGLQ